MNTKSIRDSDVVASVSYDPETGVFRSKSWRRLGEKVGGLRNGYIYLNIFGVSFRASRVAWLLQTGSWPKHHIDHINGDRTDNRFSNLRDIPQAVNNQNLRAPCCTNKTGFLGVDLCKTTGRYRASIRSKGKNITLGRFDTPERAHAEYLKAKRLLHVGCTL
jgi:hypothetical protein